MNKYSYLLLLLPIISCLNITIKRNLTNNENSLFSTDFYLNNTKLVLSFNESHKGFTLSKKYLNSKAEYLSYRNQEESYNFNYEITVIKDYPNYCDGIFGINAFKEKFGTIFIRTNNDQTITITNEENMSNEEEYVELSLINNSLIYESLIFDLSKTEVALDASFDGILLPKKILFAIKKELKLNNNLDCTFKKSNKDSRFNNLKNLTCQNDWVNKLNEEKISLSSEKGKGFSIPLKKLIQKNKNDSSLLNANLYYSDENKIILGLPFFQLHDVFYKNEGIFFLEKKELTVLKSVENKFAKKMLFFAFILIFVVFFAKIGYTFLIRNIEANVRKVTEEEEDKPINSFKGVFDEIKRLREVKQVTLGKTRKKKKIFEF